MHARLIATGQGKVASLTAAGAVAGPGAYSLYTGLFDPPWRATWEWIGIVVEFGLIGGAAGYVLSTLIWP